MTNPAKAPGWYPDPLNPGKQIYWDGTSWGQPVGVADDTDRSKQTAVAIGVLVLAGIGVVMSMQSASLLTGTGSIWTGVGIAGAGVAVAYFMRAAGWVRVVASLMLAFALFNALYMEHQISEKRDEITQMFDN